MNSVYAVLHLCFCVTVRASHLVWEEPRRQGWLERLCAAVGAGRRQLSASGHLVRLFVFVLAHSSAAVWGFPEATTIKRTGLRR